jgi:LemA protein
MVVAIAVVVVVVVLGGLLGIATYNKLIRRRNQVENAWSQVEVQLKRRHDLIPNLVEAVKGYAGHEREALEAVTAARAGAVGARSPAGQAEAENALTATLRSLFAVAESYPDLKASSSFLSLQQELEETESKIAYARQYYNDSVLSMNNAVGTFPGNLFAGMLGFHHKEAFQTAEGEAGPVQVQF